MINRKDIVQNTIEWHEIKWRKIGGTLSKGLFIKTDTLFVDLLSQYLEEFEPDEDSYENTAMRRGKDMEPFALEYLESYTGFKFEKTGWLQSEENEILGISPDGITECETIAFESKCLARKLHTETIMSQEIPLEHIAQLVHYFTVNPKLEKLYFIAFRPESVSNFIKVLTLESEVNLGTKARPVIKTIREWSDIAKYEAKELLIRIRQEKIKLTESI